MKMIFFLMISIGLLMVSCNRSGVEHNDSENRKLASGLQSPPLKLTFDPKENLDALRKLPAYVSASGEKRAILEEKIGGMLAGLDPIEKEKNNFMLLTGDSCTSQTTNVAACPEVVALTGECPGALVYSTTWCACKTTEEEPNSTIKCFTFFMYEGSSGQTIIKSVAGAWATGMSGPKWCDLAGCYFE